MIVIVEEEYGSGMVYGVIVIWFGWIDWYFFGIDVEVFYDFGDFCWVV